MSKPIHKIDSIKLRADFIAANRGKRIVRPGFILLINPRNDGLQEKRFGITVTKKIGNAIVRNRMRRRFRHLLLKLVPEYGEKGADHIMIGRQQGVERNYSRLYDELMQALAKPNRAKIRPKNAD